MIELAGLAPVPFSGMTLADLGADVVRIDTSRPRHPGSAGHPRKRLGARSSVDGTDPQKVVKPVSETVKSTSSSDIPNGGQRT
ncbi:hypothetical protein [[Mycobacterium] nativiensis]|uniref:Uncharacterized protein n=1 Tax=[Mycobacterium] nativiensis TaxID=2855503 RepID=A0ABU5XSA8_9MYCO|nr:hypothetical protein [Mycolicibacter sp. MYC340]MEB3030823.1 hypothetical protein [Mycolicibacter sp. MYC340]